MTWKPWEGEGCSVEEEKGYREFAVEEEEEEETGRLLLILNSCRIFPVSIDPARTG